MAVQKEDRSGLFCVSSGAYPVQLWISTRVRLPAQTKLTGDLVVTLHDTNVNLPKNPLNVVNVCCPAEWLVRGHEIMDLLQWHNSVCWLYLLFSDGK